MFSFLLVGINFAAELRFVFALRVMSSCEHVSLWAWSGRSMTKWDHWIELAKGVSAWNVWRETRPDVKPDLSAVSSRRMGLDLLEAGEEDNPESPAYRAITLNLAHANLREANLAGLDLTEAELSYTDLRETTLDRTALDRARLLYADMRGIRIDQARFQHANLSYANLEDVDLSLANLGGANFAHASMRGAKLSHKSSGGAIFIGADLRGADLRGCILWDADFTNADLSGADLTGADLTHVIFVNTKLRKACLNGCRVFGTSVWNVDLDGAEQDGLIISQKEEPIISLDNLDIAQFVYLMMNNKKLRDMIDTIATKAVLLLGRFSAPHKMVLDSLRAELRKRGLVPIVFDFEPPESRDLTETVSLLAHLCNLIIADLTDPRSVPQELLAIVRSLPSVTLQPIIHRSQHEYTLFEHIQRYPWVKELIEYDAAIDVIVKLEGQGVIPVLPLP
jgi:uncharacterized protein YjbI with pentapeptide repeats